MTTQDKDDIISACKRVERPGLYLFVFFLFLISFVNLPVINTKCDNLKQKLDRIETILTNQATINLGEK